jgi:hypothetical protein
MRRSATAFVALLSACGGGGGDSGVDGGSLPADAKAMQSQLAADMARSVARMATTEAGAIVVLNPGSPANPSVALTPVAGTPANTYDFAGKYDGTGNGHAETALEGRLSFAIDPTDLTAHFAGAQGSTTIAVDIIGMIPVYRGDLSFSLGMAEHRVSGNGTLTNPLNATTVTLSIDAAQPLGIKLATGAADARPNACAHSFDGTLQVDVTGPQGTLASQWRFAYGSSSVSVGAAKHTSGSGQVTNLPDTTVELSCESGGSIDEWKGSYQIDWACLPQESGSFRTTIAVKDATTLTIVDEGDTSDEAYEAKLIGSSPRAIRGFFIAGPAGGNQYREDFNWVLARDGSGFSQTSRYVWQTGSLSGLGGICSARATRL